MSFFLQKSDANLKIAHYLFTDSPQPCSPASMHCSYYSCLQKIKHILKYDFKEDLNVLENKVKGSKGNTHNIYIDEIGSLIKKVSDHYEKRKDARNVKNYLIELRHLRIEADYHDIDILKEKAEKAHEYAKDIHKIIKKHLN